MRYLADRRGLSVPVPVPVPGLSGFGLVWSLLWELQGALRLDERNRAGPGLAQDRGPGRRGESRLALGRGGLSGAAGGEESAATPHWTG